MNDEVATKTLYNDLQQFEDFEEMFIDDALLGTEIP